MSLKSLQSGEQKDLQALLAYQAYLFNKKNGGIENDADIYSGLYNVTKQFGKGYKSYDGHEGEIKSIAFNPNGKEFYTSGNDGKVLKWTLDGDNRNFTEVYSGEKVIEILAVNSDASWLAAGEGNSSIHMIPLKEGGVRYKLIAHTARINSLNFSSDGNFLYSASLDGRVLKWDLNARTCINVTLAGTNIVTIDISSGSKYIAGINSENNVVLWNPENNQDHFRIETERKNINVIRFKPDDTILAIGDLEGFVELWDVNSRERISAVKAHTAQVNDIRFNNIPGQMATAGNDRSVRIYDVRNMSDLSEPPVIIPDNDGFVVAIQFSPDGKSIVSGTNEGENNLVSRLTHSDYLVKDICSLMTRNMTQDEWNTFVGRDIPYELTCADSDFKIRIKQVK
jgi:WD40 repeat protein